MELNQIKDPTARQRRLVELNVKEQCLNIFKTAVVQRKRIETFEAQKALGIFQSAHLSLSSVTHTHISFTYFSLSPSYISHLLPYQGDDSGYQFTEPRIHGFTYDPTTGEAKRLRYL